MIDHELKNAAQLLGYKVVGLVEDGGGYFGLRMTKGKSVKHVWVNCDPEGNGPGHLSIEKPNGAPL